MGFAKFTFYFFVFWTLLNAQADAFCQHLNKYDRKKGKWNHIDGYLLNEDSIKIKGLVKWFHQSTATRFAKVTFTHENGRTKTYFPETIKGFGYDTLEFMSDSRNFFLIVENHETIRLLKNISVFEAWLDPHEKYFIPNRDTTSIELLSTPLTKGFPYYGPTWNLANDYFIQKIGQSKIKYVDPVDFDQRFSEYFSDCPDLASKIRTGVLQAKDIVEIVQEYNRCLK